MKTPDPDTTMVNIPLRLLQQLQWRTELAMPTCPICNAGHKWGHEFDCQLGKALKEVDPSTKIQEPPTQYQYEEPPEENDDFVG